MRFEVGQAIVRRNVHRNGRFGAVETARVVRDDDRGVLTWTGPGSQVMRRTTLTGDPVRRMSLQRRMSIPTMLSPAHWRDSGVLILTPPGSGHWVEPDRSWVWKDEDEFAERIGHPDYWAAPPFDGWLTDFRPDPGWEPTTLPPHWDLPSNLHSGNT